MIEIRMELNEEKSFGWNAKGSINNTLFDIYGSNPSAILRSVSDIVAEIIYPPLPYNNEEVVYNER